MRGAPPKELIPPNMPEVGVYLWHHFLDLHNARTYGMEGGNPLSYGEIKAWCDIKMVSLEPWEVEVLKAMDLLWLRVDREK